MDFLRNMVGDAARGQEYRDFAERYDRGAPYDRISDEEAEDRYREVSPNLSEEDYRLSARGAFARMSPEEREEFGRLLREEAQQQGHGGFVDRDHDGRDDRFQDPDYLADTTSRMHREEPDLLSNLMSSVLNSGGGGLVGGMTGSGMTGGEGVRGGGGGMLGNPVAKAAMAGIAATAAKRVMGK